MDYYFAFPYTAFMLNFPCKSINHAKKALILGHISSGMGEKTLALKFKKAIGQAGFQVDPIIDIFEHLKEDYEPLAKLNYDLADNEVTIMEDLPSTLKLPASDLLLILSWCFSVAAIFATGVHKKQRTVVKFFAHHPNERVLPKLYEPADLLITESLLANERALKYGIDPTKVLYMPHPYPAECETLHSSRTYVSKLAQEQGKMLKAEAKIIGCVSRLEYGKNCEFAVEAVRRLYLRNKDVVLVLKGDFPLTSPYPEHVTRFSEMLHAYKEEPWLLWDRKPTPFPQVLEEYASFDLLLHPSGAEGASHVVVECLGLSIPVVLLECSTNPFLFKDLVTFVPTTQEMRPALLPFYIPDMEELVQALEKDPLVPDKIKVQERFHERALAERVPLLFEPDPEKIKKLYAQDRKLYAL